MGQFLEERLPTQIRMGARFSTSYPVEVVQTGGGSEYRRLIHPFPVRRGVIDFTQLRADVAAGVLALYDRAFGRFAGFRVQDPDDNSTNGQRGAPTMLDMPLLYISSGVYQLIKQYGLGSTPLAIGLPYRTLFKPVAGSLLVAKNGVLVGAGVSVNTTTGRVTITPAPAYPADVMTAGCYFDIPCRFDSDLEQEFLSREVRNIASLELKELLNP